MQLTNLIYNFSTSYIQSHGWAFGKEGVCESIPTQAFVPGSTGSQSKSSNFKKKACLKTYAVQEHEGLVWLWRGNILEADADKLPKTRKDTSTYPCDTILDYNVDWQVRSKLFFLFDCSYFYALIHGSLDFHSARPR